MDNGLHQEERKQFERLLRQLHLDRLGNRLSVLDVFLTSEEHHTSEGWRRMLKDQGVDLEPIFVTQTLELLTRFGLATRRDFEGGPPRYEHRHLDDHHDHLICTCCGSITEFSDPRLESLQNEIAAEKGFHCLRHRHQIYGLCKKCLEARQPTMPLAMATAGEKLRVLEVKGCGQATIQLHNMGIAVGSELEVISCNGGPMVVAVGGTRLALGRGMAQKVLVSQSVNPASCSCPI